MFNKFPRDPSSEIHHLHFDSSKIMALNISSQVFPVISKVHERKKVTNFLSNVVEGKSIAYC